MKFMKYITLCLLMLFAVKAKAQNEAKKDSLRASKVEELRKFRETLFVEQLTLTDAEKVKFFPIYDEYQLKLFTLSEGVNWKI